MMRFSIPAAVLVAVACTAHNAHAANLTSSGQPFDGTWVMQPGDTTFDAALHAPIFSLEGGMFRRSDCHMGPIEVPADGQEHKVRNQLLFDAMSVRVIDPRRVEITEENAGKMAWQGVYTVSSDARHAQLDYEDDRAERPVTGELTYHREGELAKGQQLLSGTWRPDKLTRVSASGLTLTIATQPGTPQADAGLEPDVRFNLTESDGRSATGKIDMHTYPLTGYLQGTAIAIGRLAPHMLQINVYVDAQLVTLSRATVSDDGNTMTVGQVDSLCQSKTTFVLHKQSAQ